MSTRSASENFRTLAMHYATDSRQSSEEASKHNHLIRMHFNLLASRGKNHFPVPLWRNVKELLLVLAQMIAPASTHICNYEYEVVINAEKLIE